MTTAVVVGRFQVSKLHHGHIALLDAANRHEQLIIVVGVHPLPASCDNPLDFVSRHGMLKRAYPEAVIIPLEDTPSDQRWSQQLDALIQQHARNPLEVILYAGRDSFADSYSGIYPIRGINAVEEHSGRNMRQQLGQQSASSEDFRHGVIYATHRFRSRFHLTVDIAVLCSFKNEIHLLLGQKANRADAWRFPGGFVDANDESSEAAARRELTEETGLETCEKFSLIGNYRVKDWRESHEQHFFTCFYLVWVEHQSLEAADDLSLIQWHSIDEVPRLNFADGHGKLADALLSYLPQQGVFYVG